MQQATQQPPNIGMLILLVLCIWGALRDRAYKKAGGIRPDKFEKISLLATMAGCVLVVAVIFLVSPEAAGSLTATLTVALFGVWEIHRLRVRRKNPVKNWLP